MFILQILIVGRTINICWNDRSEDRIEHSVTNSTILLVQVVVSFVHDINHPLGKREQ